MAGSVVHSERPPFQLGILGGATCLGSERRSVDQWIRQAKLPADQRDVEDRLRANGALHYHVAADRNVLDLALDAAGSALAQLPHVSPDLVVFAHALVTSGNRPEIDVAALLVERLGLRGCLSFSITQQHCVASLAAIDCIQQAMQADPGIRNVLLVSADKTLYERHRKVGDYALQSDCAVALWLTRDPAPFEISGLSFWSDPRYYAATAKTAKLATELALNYAMINSHLFHSALRHLGWVTEQVDKVFPMNANLGAIRAFAKVGRIPHDVFFLDNVSRTGHALSCDPIMNFLEGAFDSGGAAHSVLHFTGASGCFGVLAVRQVDTPPRSEVMA